MGHEIVAVYRDAGISGSKGRDPRPGFDAMHKDAARRRFDVVMAWSVDRLVLLCHKFRYLFRAAQHGQRDSIVARAATNLRRIVAIEFGTWRSGRNGGCSGLVTFA